MGTQMVNLEWPPNLGGDEFPHFMEFKTFDFRTNSPTKNIALYIPPDAMKTGYKAEYKDDAIGRSGHDIIEGMSPAGGGGAGGSISNIISGVKSLVTARVAQGTEAGMMEFGQQVISKITGGNADTLMGNVTGKVLNPYMVAAYQGPTALRDHSFTFKMMPKNSTESLQVAKIVKAFKIAMLPSHGKGKAAIAPVGLFGYPDEFTIDFKINGVDLDTELNPLFRIGRSVLTACDVDYTTQDTTLFFDQTQHPVSVEMKLEFKELEVMHRGHIEAGY